jgi:transcriptional regulator with XRE-family HTH domain
VRRKELDLPQRHLASSGIMSAGSLIDFEKGRRWPRRATRAKLEEALGWPQGHIARLRNQRIEPDEEQTAVLTNTVGMPLMTEVVEVALNNITTTIGSLPAISDPEFTPRASGILADLRRIETSAARLARATTGDPSVVLILAAVRKTYTDMMLRAARATGATLGQQLFAARHAAELSIEEIANAAGVPVEAATAAESEAPLDVNTTAALSTMLTSLNGSSNRTPTKAGRD